MLITSAAEIDPNHYFSPTDNTAYAVNHLTLTAQPASAESGQDNALQGIRAALQLAADEYIKKQYVCDANNIESKSMPESNVLCGVYGKYGILYLVISGEKLNLGNFWSGKWVSNWTIRIGGAGVASLSGDAKVRTLPL